MLENKLLLPLGMIVARIPVGEDDSVAEQSWQMEDSAGRKRYSSDHAGKKYSVGRRFC